MWFTLTVLCAAAPVAPSDFALRAGSVGFDSVSVLSSTKDGSLLVGGERWAAMDFGSRSLSSAAPPDDLNTRARAPSGGFLARMDLDGTVRFLVGPDVGAQVDAAAELADGRIFAAGIVRERASRFGALQLIPRADDLVGFGAFVSARGDVERVVPIGLTGNVWIKEAVAAGEGVVVVGSFDGAIEGPRALRAPSKSNTPWSDGFALALGPDGGVRWSARVGSDEFTDGADRVVSLVDGTLLVTGTVGRHVNFEDGQGERVAARCGDPVSCPFLWGLDPATGATRFHNVLRNGSGMPDAVAVAAISDGGFVVGGGMGRNLRVGSAVERKRNDEVKLRAKEPVGSSWLARFTRDGALVWTRRVDERQSSLRALTVRGSEIILVGTGDLGATPAAVQPMRGEGPATLARVRLEDGGLVDALRFGRPRDAPLTQGEDNLRVERVLITADGRLALAGALEERAWLHLSSGPVELVSVGAGAPGFANESDVFIAIVSDPMTLASPALPPTTSAREDPFEGCVARREGALLVPCEPRAREGRRAIHHSCIEGMRRAGDRRVWTCGPLADEIPIVHDGLELFFLETVPQGRLALYGEHVGMGECGGLKRNACRVTARLLDGDGGARWTHALERSLGGASDTSISEVVLADDTLYVVESCYGYELGHRGLCDQLIALDVGSGRVRWRSAPLTAHDGFAIASDVIVAFSHGTHGTSKSKRYAARIVALDRKSGALLGEIPATDVVAVLARDERSVIVMTGPAFSGPHTAHTLSITRTGARVRMTLH